MKNVKIKEVMTKMPVTVAQNAPVNEAMRLMKKYNIRHLPVLDQGELVCVISERDVRTAEAFHEFKHFSVEWVMTDFPYTVSPEEKLSQVVETMATRKIGSTLVLSPTGVVVGIFTAHDALGLLAA